MPHEVGPSADAHPMTPPDLIQQRVIGLVGGMSWESTALYYRLINEAMRTALGGHHNARSVLVTVNFAEVLAHADGGHMDRVAEILISAGHAARRGGADFIVMTSNSAHTVADELAGALDIPLLHIADATAAAVKQAGFARVGLMGTLLVTAADGFYVRYLHDKHGIAVITPTEAERNVLHSIILDELTKGTMTDESKTRCMQIVDSLAARGAQGVVVGCTELPLLFGQADTPVRLFDTTRLHAQAAVDYALRAL